MKKYSEKEILEIETSYDELIQLVGETMTLEEVGFIGKAYDLCCSKYDGMRMRSGRPMVLHVLEVAKICYSEMGMHSKTWLKPTIASSFSCSPLYPISHPMAKMTIKYNKVRKTFACEMPTKCFDSSWLF